MSPQKQAEYWNKKVPVGTEIEFSSYPGAATQRFKTRTPATVLGFHTAVVWLEGKSGCVAINACCPVKKP